MSGGDMAQGHVEAMTYLSKSSIENMKRYVFI